MSTAFVSCSYLAVAVLCGIGMTHLADIELLAGERLFFGWLLGLMLLVLTCFGLSLAFGLGWFALLGALALCLLVGLCGWLRHRVRRGRRPSLPEQTFRDRIASSGISWHLLLVLAGSWAFFIHFFAQAYVLRSGYLWAGYLNIWADWAAHLSYAGSFAYADNLPPRFPILSGHRLDYPFLVDFFAAMLARLGLGLTGALIASSEVLALAFPGIAYFAGLRFTRSRGAAALGTGLFLLGGGWGFSYLWSDWRSYHGSAPFLLHLPREYTLPFGHSPIPDIQWLNPVLAYLVPQRDTLFGFAVVLIALALLFTATRPGGGSGEFVGAGLIMAATPLFSFYGYAIVVGLAALWAVMYPGRRWLWFFVPALVLGAPQEWWLVPSTVLGILHHPLAGGPGFIRWEPFWLADADGAHLNPIWFWLLNTGLFLPLLLVGQLLGLKGAGLLRGFEDLVAPGFQRFFAPLWLLFVIPNFVVLQPWDWDNTKWFVIWYLVGWFMVSSFLLRLARRLRPKVVSAAVLGLVITSLALSGSTDLVRASNWNSSAYQFVDYGGLRVAHWARRHTNPHAIFLVAPDPNEPIAALSGRTVVLGYPGWLYSYGIDYYPRYLAVIEMLRGGGGAVRLLDRYRVGYVVIGSQELALGAKPAFFAAHGKLVYAADGYKVYRVDPG